MIHHRPKTARVVPEMARPLGVPPASALPYESDEMFDAQRFWSEADREEFSVLWWPVTLVLAALVVVLLQFRWRTLAVFAGGVAVVLGMALVIYACAFFLAKAMRIPRRLP